MKINGQHIFKRGSDSSVSIQDKPWPGPVERDWRIMVSAFGVGLFLLSLFAWKIYLSDKLADGLLNSEAPTVITPVRTLDKKRLEADLLIMQTRRETYNKQKLAPAYKTADPAL